MLERNKKNKNEKKPNATRSLQAYASAAVLSSFLFTHSVSLSLVLLLIALLLLPGEWRLTMDARIDGMQIKKWMKYIYIYIRKYKCNCTPIFLKYTIMEFDVIETNSEYTHTRTHIYIYINMYVCVLWLTFEQYMQQNRTDLYVYTIASNIQFSVDDDNVFFLLFYGHYFKTK